MYLEPLLHLFPTHRALGRPRRNMAMLDGNNYVSAPLAHNHVAARQHSYISNLLIAHLAREGFGHLFFCLGCRPIGLVVQRHGRR